MRRSIAAGQNPASGGGATLARPAVETTVPLAESSRDMAGLATSVEFGFPAGQELAIAKMPHGSAVLRHAGRAALAIAGMMRGPLCSVQHRLRVARAANPREQSDVDGASGPSPSLRSPLSPMPSRWAAGLDVLVVDDNASNRFLLERYFWDSGARLRAAENGADAVASYTERRADLVLLDLAMPVMDGNQAARCIRKLEEERSWRAATLVALTANSAPAARAAAYEAGMDDFLEKPLRRQVLVEYVQERLVAAGWQPS